MNPLKFSRGFWEMAHACGGTRDNILRDYDILSDHKKGLTIGQLSHKYGLAKSSVWEIVNKYK